jgi:FkbH-like protein
MKLSEDQCNNLLAMQSAQEIKSLMAVRSMAPTLQQASKLRQHLETLDAPATPIRLGVVHTYTSELLDPWLHFGAALNQLNLDIYHAPYGTTVQEASRHSGLFKHTPDITLLLLTLEDLHPAFQIPKASIKGTDKPAIQDKAESVLKAIVHRFRDNIPGHIIVTVLPSMSSPGLGLYDDMAEQSENHWWSQIKTNVAGYLRADFRGVSYLDLDQLLMRHGRDNFFDARLWYSTVFPFSPLGALAVSNAVTTITAAIKQTRAKVIVVDADNTLWGGVIGEDGIDGIALGPDYPGRAFVDFQKRLLSLQQRGFILALCSKNNPDDLSEVLENHPHQLLKNEHFAAQRVNWLPKPDNLRAIAEELNLGLDSFIFVDDSDYECSAVRHSLSDVTVVQVPSRPTEIPGCLDAVARLEIVSLTAEDLEKTALYSQERMRKTQREQLTETGGSIDDYLRSLNMTMTVGLDDLRSVARLTQLTQKTNQFNLTTQRYSEKDVSGMITNEQFSVYHFSLADNFGNSGIVGLAIAEQTAPGAARIDTFLMSCRVIGRLAEQAFLHTIVHNLTSRGVTALSADYIPTRKNVLVEHFLPDNGFTRMDDGSYYCELDGKQVILDKNFPINIEGPV